MDQTKYEVCLDLINSILRALGYEETEELIDFKNVKREDLIKPEVMELIEGKEKEFFPLFDKEKARYYKRKHISCHLLDICVKIWELNLRATYAMIEKEKQLMRSLFMI